MSAGFLIIGQPLIKGNFILAGMIAVIGVALALLIERLSLGGLSSIRIASAHLKRVQDDFYTMLRQERRVAEQFEQDDLDRQIKALRKERKTAIIFAGLGMVLSAGIGDVFWHSLFETLGVVGYILSTSCAMVIGLTFVHSELYKVVMDGVLKEILADMHLMKVAVAVEGESMQVDMMVDAFDAVRANEDVRKPAQLKVERTVVRRLSSYADQVSAVGNEVSAYNRPGVTVVEGSMAPLQLQAPRGKYHQHKAELIRLLRSNPQLSQSDIALHFSVSKSTANGWLKKLKAGE